MVRVRYGFDEKKIKKFIDEGRGIGTGKNYKPWLTVADVPSLGRSHRVYISKTERFHHLLSDNEYYAFLLQWWDDNVIDIREQFPLIDRRETLEIAACGGIRHPVDPRSRTLLVLTTDLIITKRLNTGEESVAYAVKPVKELSNKRTIEKLEIERKYWEKRNIKWRILTDLQVKTQFTNNLAWIMDSTFRSKSENIINFDNRILKALHRESFNNRRTSISHICQMIDKDFFLTDGLTLSSLRRLLSNKKITVDLNKPNIHSLPVGDFIFNI